MPTGKTGVCTTDRDLGLQGTSVHPMGKFVGNPSTTGSATSGVRLDPNAIIDG